MNRDITIQQELQTIASNIAHIPYVPTYTVPKHYFEGLASSIVLKLPTTNTYTVPKLYFDTLATTVLLKIKQDANELTTVAPTLANIAKVNVYAAPPQYFESLPKYTSATPVVAMPQRKKIITLIKYAAAACIVGVVAVLGIQYATLSTTTNKENDIVPGTGMTYTQIKNIDVDKAIDSINTTEMTTYLCDKGLVVCTDNNEAAVQQELDQLNINDADLNTYFGDAEN